MTVHLIIDGYNVARAEPGAGFLALEEQRGRLLGRLAAYRRIRGRGMDVTVVFDAAEGTSAGGTKGRQGGLSVVYTAIGETADQRIEKLTRTAGPGGVVVTSDQLLAGLVRRRGIETLEAGSFLAKMEQAVLMDLKGGAAEETEMPRLPEKKGPAHRKKKRERQRERLRAKL